MYTGTVYATVYVCIIKHTYVCTCTLVYIYICMWVPMYMWCVPQHSNLFKDLLENIYMIHTCTSGTNTKIQDGTPSVHSLHTACS